MESWSANIDKMCGLLYDLSVLDPKRHEIGPDAGFNSWQQLTVGVRDNRRRLFLIGNGASASMASHFATDIAKNGGLMAQVFTDPSLITALSNDISYEQVFAEPLRWYMQKKDMLIAISSSGNSANIVKAIEVAKQRGGTVITLSAMGEKNRIRGMGDLNFYVAAQTYGHAETAHAAILHHWMDIIESGNVTIQQHLI